MDNSTQIFIIIIISIIIIIIIIIIAVIINIIIIIINVIIIVIIIIFIIIETTLSFFKLKIWTFSVICIFPTGRSCPFVILLNIEVPLLIHIEHKEGTVSSSKFSLR